MKKLVLLFLSILSIVIIGCKVDNILGISKN
ncbi:unclassified [Brachyspira pilosicoli WesB]|uniref:Unclassified n=2 Tax=Brachyspira pilosicoli TaxID=52584 RepID=K0JHK3_BRAPL|nr:unclassified [Brachyspira pilosicoli WesB]